MKKYIALLLCTALSLLMVGCSGQEETSAESEIYEDESTSAALSEALGDSETSTDTEAKGCKSSLIGGMAALLSAAGALLFKKKCKEI